MKLQGGHTQLSSEVLQQLPSLPPLSPRSATRLSAALCSRFSSESVLAALHPLLGEQPLTSKAQGFLHMAAEAARPPLRGFVTQASAAALVARLLSVLHSPAPPQSPSPRYMRHFRAFVVPAIRSLLNVAASRPGAVEQHFSALSHLLLDVARLDDSPMYPEVAQVSEALRTLPQALWTVEAGHVLSQALVAARTGN